MYGSVFMLNNLKEQAYSAASEIIEIAQGNDILPPDAIAESFLDCFWSYKINVEYIEKPDTKIVRGIFDRLNRNGERLNSAELRNAKYFDSEIYKQIIKLLLFTPFQ